MEIAGVEITHPEKIIFPEAKITKLEMVQYYQKVAKQMLPYMKDRPLTLHRFPNGIDKDGFYQKNASEYFPDYIKTIKVKTEDGENIQILCGNEKSLIYLANQGTVAFHIWLSKKDNLYKPDKVVFDLDPPKDSFEKVKEGAQITGDFLRSKGIDPNLMTTGQNGFHVWYKIQRRNTYDELKPKLLQLVQELEDKNPDLFTTAVRKNKREGKIFLDYLRNSYGQTSVCPYSLRANQNAGIATPIQWKDLKNIKSADQFNLTS
ncbi:ATP-dependent DNA ligase [Aequorivita sp. H23M31]|uniref:ATP-dependent DNA ligase n=1 Tax=Aequorivita ciconiae TaxID=2494375 RepID=A0A451FSE6_9FLAO|nr:non-homologous end-joining DNA ligase [Aequorivita sp. H23M31]QAA80328.1 ATP-dependent DNA ligase [Aequorivita sp. H23M31]